MAEYTIKDLSHAQMDKDIAINFINKCMPQIKFKKGVKIRAYWDGEIELVKRGRSIVLFRNLWAILKNEILYLDNPDMLKSYIDSETLKNWLKTRYENMIKEVK